MKKIKVLVLALLFMFLPFWNSPASAVQLTLFEWGFNVNGTIYETGDPLPGYFNTSGFDWSTGLGTLSIRYNPWASGDFFILAFFDHEIDEEINTFFNEVGTATGTPLPGQSWEIDEPGWVDGDIYLNFQDNTLDKGIGISVFGDTIFPDDVSMAMGWDFNLMMPGDTAWINFFLRETAPSSGFYLTHTDPDSNYSIYFSSTLHVEPIPEPGTIILVGLGLIGVVLLVKRGTFGR